MPASRKRSKTAHNPGAGKRKTALRKQQTTKRQSKSVGNKHRVAGERSGSAHPNGETKTVRSSSRKRAARSGDTEAGTRKRSTPARPVAPDPRDMDIYGIALSEAERSGDEYPVMPDATRNTASTEVRSVPATGSAKARKTPGRKTAARKTTTRKTAARKTTGRKTASSATRRKKT